MRKITALLTCCVCIAGCRKDSSIDGMKPTLTTNRSIAEMQNEYDRRKAEHDRKCLNASPDIVKANELLCAQERNDLAPLGNALMEAKIKQGQQTTQP